MSALTLADIAAEINHEHEHALDAREHPGYWHDIDVSHGSASKRPVKPLGLAWRLAGTQYTWATAPDDGSHAQLCGEVSA